MLRHTSKYCWWIYSLISMNFSWRRNFNHTIVLRDDCVYDSWKILFQKQIIILCSHLLKVKVGATSIWNKNNSSDLFATYIFYLGKLNGQEIFLGYLITLRRRYIKCLILKLYSVKLGLFLYLICLKHNMLFSKV